MAETTPAIERARAAFAGRIEAHWGGPGDAWSVSLSDDALPAALAAALSDPADSDWLPRAMYVLHVGVKGLADAQTALMWWLEIPEFERADWRAVADGLRMMLTGSGS
jgi:hypothetical protein